MSSPSCLSRYAAGARRFAVATALAAAALAACPSAFAQAEASRGEASRDSAPLPGVPPVVDAQNLYSETAAGKFSPATAGALSRVYVPHVASGEIVVIDPATFAIVDRFNVGGAPQHVVPSYDLKTLWVSGSVAGRGRRGHGLLTAIDPNTGKAGKSIRIDDAYNLYFTPDGRYAIVVAEQEKRLDFVDPVTMARKKSIATPGCSGINHADISIDSRYAIFTCEFGGTLVKIDLVALKVVGYLKLSKGGMPQDIRISPDGSLFYVADMMADGVFLIDGAAFREVGFVATGVGAHGLYPSRDGKKLYVANRGSNKINGPARGAGSVSVIDFATGKVEADWQVPGGGSPDMGNVSADGKRLWLSGRFDGVVYAFDTTSGAVDVIATGRVPHGLTVWPQPGRYSLGHTGNMR
ncbi:MAG: YncE family protein [Bauldia sp.]